MPKAMVATTTSTSSRANASWCRARTASSRPAWYGHGPHACRAEVVGQRLDVLPAERVDDAALATAAPDVGEDVLPRAAPVTLAVRRENQVLAEEGALEAVGLHHAELADDVADDLPRRGGRERQDRDAAELGLEPAEPPVGRPEVVPPFGDAVRLVDDDERHADAGEKLRRLPSSPSGAT
jgi:hypothetical protein